LLDERGVPLYVLEEERFNRVKHSGFGTFESLKSLERAGLVDPAKVTDLVYSFEMDEQIAAHLMEKCQANVTEAFGPEVLAKASAYFHQPEQGFSCIHGLGRQTIFKDAVAELQRLFPNALETSYKHHLCHAASAFYPAPFSSAAVLIIDGSGRIETTTIWRADEGGLELLQQIELPHSIGILYWLFSHYLWLEEGQTMGLAAYGKPVFKDLLYDQVVALGDSGDFRFKAPIVSWFDMDNEYAISVIEAIFGVRARRSDAEPLTQFHADVAASIQAVTEEAVLNLAAHAKHLTRESRLCLAGGVIQNCVANGRLVAEKIFDQVWIQPMANDAGTALGAALHRHYCKRPERFASRWRMTTAQLGLGYEDRQIESYLQRLEISYRKNASPDEEAARRIAEGQVVGWFQARAEVGPRALGGRSILADPRQRFNPFAVNQIKQRQPWRPFAPSILERQESQFIGFESASPFMILSFPILPALRPELPAVCHVDGSARIQTVSAESCGVYYCLLVQFFEKTRIPAVLNTSFNLRGVPIVQHPLDAIRDFLISGIDCLFLNGFVIEEKPEIDVMLREALTTSPFLSLYEALSSQPHPLLIVEHGGVTSEESRRKRLLLRMFEWLRLPYKHLAPDGLADAVSSEAGQHHLISIAHAFDERLLRQLPEGQIKRITVSAIDRRMYPAPVTADRFLRMIDYNRRELRRLIGEQEVLVWADGDDLEDALHGLGRFGIKPTALISDCCDGGESAANHIQSQPSVYLRDRHGRAFLVISSSVMDRRKSELRRYGYHSGAGYLVWEA
jgi:carbamoyltransferase